MLDQTLHLFMVKQIAVLWTNFRVIPYLLDLQRFSLYPFTILPVTTLGRDFSKIDLRVEVGSKRVPVVACITVEDISCVYLIKLVLLSIGTEDIGCTRVKTRAQ